MIWLPATVVHNTAWSVSAGHLPFPPVSGRMVHQSGRVVVSATGGSGIVYTCFLSPPRPARRVPITRLRSTIAHSNDVRVPVVSGQQLICHGLSASLLQEGPVGFVTSLVPLADDPTKILTEPNLGPRCRSGSRGTLWTLAPKRSPRGGVPDTHCRPSAGPVAHFGRGGTRGATARPPWSM